MSSAAIIQAPGHVSIAESKLTPSQLVAQREALKNLLADIEDYQTINNLGGSDNCTQAAARAALAKAGKP